MPIGIGTPGGQSGIRRSTMSSALLNFVQSACAPLITHKRELFRGFDNRDQWFARSMKKLVGIAAWFSASG
jgi:hypothetical protein